MKLLDFTKPDDGPAMVAKALARLNEIEPVKCITVALTAANEYHLIAGNVTLPEMLWLIERGREITLQQDHQP